MVPTRRVRTVGMAVADSVMLEAVDNCDAAVCGRCDCFVLVVRVGNGDGGAVATSGLRCVLLSDLVDVEMRCDRTLSLGPRWNCFS